MELFDLIIKNSNLKAFSEADDMGIPDGNLNDPNNVGFEGGDEPPQADTYVDDGGGSYEDTGYQDDTYQYDDTGDMSGEPNDPFADVDDSEISLVQDLRENYAKLYNNQYSAYQKFQSENLDSTEFSKEFDTLKKQYKTTLNLLYKYIETKYNNESTTTRIMEFINFKEQFSVLAKTCNRLLDKLNSKEDTNSVFM